MHPFEMIYNLNKVPIEEYTEAAICFVGSLLFYSLFYTQLGRDERKSIEERNRLAEEQRKEKIKLEDITDSE